MTIDGSLGGYLEKHSRPPAFEGTDGSYYSAEIYVEDNPDDRHAVGGALLFVRWSSDGAQPVGHLETDFLVFGADRDEVVAALHRLSLHDLKDHLERGIERSKELPAW